MTKEELLDYLKTSLFIQDPQDIVRNDPEYIALSEEHLTRVLNIALLQVNPKDSLESISDGSIYPVILLAKKEVYHILATKSAPLHRLSAGGGGGTSALDKQQRFQHYMELIQQVTGEYREFKEDSESGNLQSIEVLLDDRYYTRRNYDLAEKPIVAFKIDSIGEDYVECTITESRSKKFHSFRVYISEETILDKYSSEIINPKATLVETIHNIHRDKFRVSELESGKTYHLVVAITEMNGLITAKEIVFDTLIEDPLETTEEPLDNEDEEIVVEPIEDEEESTETPTESEEGE